MPGLWGRGPGGDGGGLLGQVELAARATPAAAPRADRCALLGSRALQLSGAAAAPRVRAGDVDSVDAPRATWPARSKLTPLPQTRGFPQPTRTGSDSSWVELQLDGEGGEKFRSQESRMSNPRTVPGSLPHPRLVHLLSPCLLRPCRVPGWPGSWGVMTCP